MDFGIAHQSLFIESLPSLGPRMIMFHHRGRGSLEESWIERLQDNPSRKNMGNLYRA
jgi:hypothetical protein